MGCACPDWGLFRMPLCILVAALITIIPTTVFITFTFVT